MASISIIANIPMEDDRTREMNSSKSSPRQLVDECDVCVFCVVRLRVCYCISYPHYIVEYNKKKKLTRWNGNHM